MVYQNKFVAVVKVGGNILREKGGCVYLPFASEYSLLLKNLESRRAVADIHIDGKTIGPSVVVNPNSQVEIERFIQDLDKGNRFKFVRKTEKIIDYRGDNVDDGFIRIEFRYEKYRAVTIDDYSMNHYYHVYYPVYHPVHIPLIYRTYDNTTVLSNDMYTSNTTKVSYHADTSLLSSTSEPQMNCYFKNQLRPNQDEGITVNGSVSNQKFCSVSVGELEENSYTIVIKLKGFTEKTKSKITRPITVKEKIQCSVCGKKCSTKYDYCPDCGNCLLK